MRKEELLKIIKDAAKRRKTTLDLRENQLSELPPRIGQLSSLTTLDLSRNQLGELPPEIGLLSSLTMLNLNKNQLSELPPRIGQLSSLTTLDLSRNQLGELPPEIGLLNSLTMLNLSKNQLNELPPEIGLLSSLTTLDLSGSQLEELPPEIELLSNLTTLDLSRNQLGELPPEIGLLSNLTTLNLSGNQLRELPPEIGLLSSLTTLNLSGNQLRELPPEIGLLSSLTMLNLSKNQLRELPPEIGQLSRLTSLDLSGSQLEELPPEIWQLTHLRRLELSKNQLGELPPIIGQLSSLTSLNLSGNQLRELPPEIGQLSSLTWLDLSKNQLGELPSVILQLSSLTSLNLSGTQVGKLPPEIRLLRSLTSLELSKNQLEKLPPEIGQLSSLTSLNLSRNQLGELPPEIGLLTHLKWLELSDNPVETPPPEIIKKGTQAIISYLQQLEQEGVAYLYEAKLLIVGEGEAGKTSLARKIENQDYQLQPDLASTEGIDIIKWHFPLPRQDRDFQVNIWDFGGQEIYHATHQFFLTKRSLYALVADNRKEHTDLYYWLNVVELLSDNSPLLIIQNEKDDRSVEINLPELRSRFSNLKESLPVNLKTNRGLADILGQLKHYLSNLPHVGDRLPKTWLAVRRALEASEHNYISLADYLVICSENGLDREQDKYQLSGYLHDLGVCLHFQDDFVLRQTVILKPTWGTDAVYRVLDNKQVRESMGRFSEDDLALIWAEEKYVAKQIELLRLMVKFKLCYPLPNQPGWYIAPHLLKKEQPGYPWDETNNLLLRYEYKFMPKGILTRFVVTMHRYIEQQPYVWQSGVILAKEDTRAEVIEYYDRREITIRVAGRYKRDLMTTVSYELDEIHRTYSRLDYKKLVPCNCSSCKNSQKPYFYNFESLRRRLAAGKYDTECDISYESVNVRSLIDDIGGQVPGPGHRRVEELQKLISIKHRRLQELKEQQAEMGLHTPPHIKTEIADIEMEIEQLLSESGRLH